MGVKLGVSYQVAGLSTMTFKTDFRFPTGAGISHPLVSCPPGTVLFFFTPGVKASEA